MGGPHPAQSHGPGGGALSRTLSVFVSTLDPCVQPDHQDAVAAGDQGDAAGGRRGKVREGAATLHTSTVNLTPLWATRRS